MMVVKLQTKFGKEKNKEKKNCCFFPLTDLPGLPGLTVTKCESPVSQAVALMASVEILAGTLLEKNPGAIKGTEMEWHLNIVTYQNVTPPRINLEVMTLW